jgi:hypothetical protein
MVYMTLDLFELQVTSAVMQLGAGPKRVPGAPQLIHYLQPQLAAMLQALREDGTAFQLPKAVASAVAQAELILPAPPTGHKRGTRAMAADEDAGPGGEGGGRSKRAKRPMFRYSDLAEDGDEGDLDLEEQGDVAEAAEAPAGLGLPPFASASSADVDAGGAAAAGGQRGKRGRGQGGTGGEAAVPPAAPRGGGRGGRNSSSSSLRSQGAGAGGGGDAKGTGWTLAAQQLVAMVLHAVVSPDQMDSRVPTVRKGHMNIHGHESSSPQGTDELRRPCLLQFWC